MSHEGNHDGPLTLAFAAGAGREIVLVIIEIVSSWVEAFSAAWSAALVLGFV
jgi:hypothetical protein